MLFVTINNFLKYIKIQFKNKDEKKHIKRDKRLRKSSIQLQIKIKREKLETKEK